MAILLFLLDTCGDGSSTGCHMCWSFGRQYSQVEYRSVRVHLDTLVDKMLLIPAELHYFLGHYVDRVVLSKHYEGLVTKGCGHQFYYQYYSFFVENEWQSLFVHIMSPNIRMITLENDRKVIWNPTCLVFTQILQEVHPNMLSSKKIQHGTRTMSGKNWRLVADEAVEFKK